MTGLDSVLFAGDPYALPNAATFLVATLTGAIVTRFGRKEGILGSTFLGAALGIILVSANGDRIWNNGLLLSLVVFRGAIGAIGGFLGATVVIARKKRKRRGRVAQSKAKGLQIVDLLPASPFVNCSEFLRLAEEEVKR